MGGWASVSGQVAESHLPGTQSMSSPANARVLQNGCAGGGRRRRRAAAGARGNGTPGQLCRWVGVPLTDLRLRLSGMEGCEGWEGSHERGKRDGKMSKGTLTTQRSLDTLHSPLQGHRAALKGDLAWAGCGRIESKNYRTILIGSLSLP